MEEMYFATVPVNQTGIVEIENGVDHSDNFKEFVIPPEEYKKLWQSHVFDIINNRFGLMIDDNESEKITAEQLEKVYQAINTVTGVFLTAVDLAIKHKTVLYLDF